MNEIVIHQKKKEKKKMNNKINNNLNKSYKFYLNQFTFVSLYLTYQMKIGLPGTSGHILLIVFLFCACFWVAVATCKIYVF